jgi:hypothetical protein
MPELTAQRRLVKSPPELWSELSELERLARHLDAFGEIRITRLEPETSVAWEGERASGTVSIEASGWGTKVTLTASLPESQARAEEAAVEPEPEEPEEPEDPDPAPEPPPEPAPQEPVPAVHRRGFLARLRAFWLAEPLPEPPPSAESPPRAEPAVEVQTAELEAVEPPAEPEPPAVPVPAPETDGELGEERARQALDAALDALGAAHHRPFSRA